MTLFRMLGAYEEPTNPCMQSICLLKTCALCGCRYVKTLIPVDYGSRPLPPSLSPSLSPSLPPSVLPFLPPSRPTLQLPSHPANRILGQPPGYLRGEGTLGLFALHRVPSILVPFLLVTNLIDTRFMNRFPGHAACGIDYGKS